MAQYTELRYFHLPPKLALQTSLQVININNLISELQLLLNTKVDKLYNKQLSQKSFTITDKNTISKSQNLIVDLLNLINSLPDIVLSDWNTLDVDDMSYIKNKPNVPILDLSGLIPASYLPSYVDDILEYPSFHDLPQPGEPGKIYVTTDNDLTYRWSGTTYIEISKSIITGVKGDAEADYRIGNVNLTAANIGLGNVVNIDLSKAIKGITRNGLTFTYTCLDGTTGTFDQQDNNTTYSAGTGLLLTNTAFSVKLGYTTSGNNRAVQADTNGNLYVTQKDNDTTYSAGTGLSLTNTTFALSLTKKLVTDALGYTPPTTDHTYDFAGVSFSSGQSNTGEHDANKITSNGVWYYTSNGPAKTLGASTDDGALYSQAYSTSWVGQIAQDYRNGRLFVRGKNNNSWLSWLRVALTGESLPASDVYAWAKASTKPSYTLDEVSDGSTRKLANYLPLNGGTLTGKVTVNSSYRNAGVYGVYNSHYLGHVWSIGNSYAISADGKDPASLYGMGYFHTDWSNSASYNTNNANKTALGTYAGGHQIGFFNNGVLGTSIGLNGNVWTKGGFIKKDGTSSQFLKADGSVDSNAYITGITKSMVTTALGYTPLSTGGGTLTGDLYIGNSSNTSSLNVVFRRNGDTYYVGAGVENLWLCFRDGNSSSNDNSISLYKTYSSFNKEVRMAGDLNVTGAINTDSYINCTKLNAIDVVTVSNPSGAARLRLSNSGVLNANNVIEFSQDDSGNTKHFQIQDRMDLGNTRRYFSIWGYNYGSLISAGCASGSNYCCVGIGGKNELYWDTTAVLRVYGNAKATAWNTTSDIRLKDVKGNTDISIETIANAPLFYFYWKDKLDENKHVGTSAQYWLKVLPEVVSGTDESKFAVDYGVTALTSAITVAREVVKLDKKIKLLEEENKQLKEELLLLKSQINDILTTINKSTNNK